MGVSEGDEPASGSGLPRRERGSRGVEGADWSGALYSMILKTLKGFLLDVMTVATPAAVAISAAISFVSIPPVPRLEPSVAVLTAAQKSSAGTNASGYEVAYLLLEWLPLK